MFAQYSAILFWTLTALVTITYAGILFSLIAEQGIAILLTAQFLFLIQVWGAAYYLIVVLVIISGIFFIKRTYPKKRGWPVALFSAVIILIVSMPYIRNPSWLPVATAGAQLDRVTHHMQPTIEPATRLRQLADRLLDSGCRLWIDRWTEEGRYVWISEWPHGVSNCIEGIGKIYDVEQRTWVSDATAIQFLSDRPWPEQRNEGAETILEHSDDFHVLDILPDPAGTRFAVVIGQSEFWGPNELLIITPVE